MSSFCVAGPSTPSHSPAIKMKVPRYPLTPPSPSPSPPGDPEMRTTPTRMTGHLHQHTSVPGSMETRYGRIYLLNNFVQCTIQIQGKKQLDSFLCNDLQSSVQYAAKQIITLFFHFLVICWEMHFCSKYFYFY